MKNSKTSSLKNKGLDVELKLNRDNKTRKKNLISPGLPGGYLILNHKINNRS